MVGAYTRGLSVTVHQVTLSKERMNTLPFTLLLSRKQIPGIQQVALHLEQMVWRDLKNMRNSCITLQKTYKSAHRKKILSYTNSLNSDKPS